MCLTRAEADLGDLSKWNWDGDVILHDTIVPSARPVPGTRHQYRIDVREFLVSERNAVMRETLDRKIPAYLRRHHGSLPLFRSRGPRSFDYRAAVIAGYVADTISYRASRGRDPWLFPDETLAEGSGDCEDRAFLLASLLLASGVSPYNVRVAFGRVLDGVESYDHMWVMYRKERGSWSLLEPLRRRVCIRPEATRTGSPRMGISCSEDD